MRDTFGGNAPVALEDEPLGARGPEEAATTARDSTGDEWQQREPLSEPPARYVPFPAHLLPEPYASYVARVVSARQCDPAAVALPMLAALAGTIGTARTLHVAPDWWVPSVLWVAIVAPSGAVKTPAFRAALHPVEEVDRRDREAWSVAHDAFERDRLVYEAELSDWRKKKADRGEPPEAPIEPTLPRIIVEDATLQALGRVLAENPRGALLARDELSGWARSFDQFTGATGADLARWLEIHRAGPLRVDRAGAGHLYVPRAAVSICGTIQTDILPRAFDAEHLAAGLLARFLLAAPPEPIRRWDAMRSAETPDAPALFCRFAALRALDLPPEGEQPRALVLTQEAADRYGEWFAEHEVRRQNTEPGPWRSALSKLEEIPFRLALVLSLAHSKDPANVEVANEDTMRRALELADWFRVEGERVYYMLAETAEERQDRELVAWVADHPDCSAREVAQGFRRYRGAGGTSQAEADLSRLEAAGLIKPTTRKGTRGPAATGYRAVDSSAPSTSTGFDNSQRENEKLVDVDTEATPENGPWRTEL